MTTISVVIPVLNDAQLLAGCLAALAAQSRLPDEVVVVDAGSADDSVAIASAAGARVLHASVPGIFPTSAVGFDAATGDVIARLDADSLPPVDWIARVEAALVDGSGPAAITGPGDFYGGGRIAHWLGKTAYIGGYFWSMGWLLGHPPLFGSNFAMRSTFWQRVRDTVHSDGEIVHDDLDLSIHVQPGMTVRYDPTLRVGISARPFGSWSGFWRRIHWAYLTLALNWREESLLVRRRRFRTAAQNGARN